MSTRPLMRLTAAGLALADGMLHAAVTGHHYEQALYMGILFSLAVVFLSMLGLGLIHEVFGVVASPAGRATRVAGILLMAGLLAGYFLTRTIGFPGFSAGWDNLGLTTKGIEALLLVLLAAELAAPRTASRQGHVS